MARSLEVLANAIKSRMKERGVTQVELQKLSKVTQSQLSQYLNRKMAPTLENLERIATALETTPADLLGGVTPPPAKEILQSRLREAQDRITALEIEIAETRAIPPDLVALLAQAPREGRLGKLFREELERLVRRLGSASESSLSEGTSGDAPPLPGAPRSRPTRK
jgi:transcriptional regulator with XRE-family HTH domain